MTKTILACALALPLMALATRYVVQRSPQADQGLRAGTFDPPRDAPGFTLDGSNGKKLSLRDELGKVVILEFGYTYCEEVCPITVGHLTEVYRKLGDKTKDVQMVYVTVDPKRDTPARLREHLAEFNPSFLGATGTPEELTAVQKAYGVSVNQVVSPNKAVGYAFSHTSSIYLIDPQGKLRELVPFGTKSDDIVHDIEVMLKSRA